MFLDEPTTGLDAFAALNIMDHMSCLAALGHTIIASVHQPRSAIWDMFHKASSRPRPLCGCLHYIPCTSSEYPEPCGNACGIACSDVMIAGMHIRLLTLTKLHESPSVTTAKGSKHHTL